MNPSRHDSNFAFPRRDNSGTIRPNEPRAAGLQELPRAHHVEHRNALGDADHQLDFRGSGFHDGVGRKRRGHKNYGSVSSGFVHCLLNTIEDRPAFVRGAAFTGCDPTDDLRSVFRASFGVECTFTPGDPLHNDARRFIYKDAHARLAAATTFSAASFIVSATMKFNPDCCKISLPCSTFVPSSRNTTGS